MEQRELDSEQEAIVRAVHGAPRGTSASEILEVLEPAIALRTLQYRLKKLVESGHLRRAGESRQTRYFLGPSSTFRVAEGEPPYGGKQGPSPRSAEAQATRDYVRQPQEARKPVGYDRAFLDGYRPNTSAYLSKAERAHLAKIGHIRIAPQPAGSYAKQILQRLLIDLAWNSSRLEGNTYSFLDTKRLIEFRKEAPGRPPLEAQMILNHKDAIEFLVSAADEIDFDRRTILSLHGLLANNLLADPGAGGRLRTIPVGIGASVFHPLEVPQLIEEYFLQILSTAAAIDDPFEQSLFVMVHLPYLQPFDDVNKRVSRLAANIPFIKKNLAPLSFTDVPKSDYLEATLGVYERKRPELLKDVFIWAYERSAERYAAVRQSLGEPDPFRLRYRTELRDFIADIIRARLGRKEAFAQIQSRAESEIDEADREQFIREVEDDLTSVHEGTFARYQVRPSEYDAWREVWERR